jgi:hypothetical protein
MSTRRDSFLEEDLRISRKIMKLVKDNNFVFESWLPLIEQIHNKNLRNFLSAFRNYIEYLNTVKHDGKLPRKAYELALKEVEKDGGFKNLIESLVKKIERARLSLKQKKD